MPTWWGRLIPRRKGEARRPRPGQVRIESEHGYSIEYFDDYDELRERIAERTFFSGVPHSATVLDEPVEGGEK